MRLVTVQPRCVYDKIMRTGRYVAIPEMSPNLYYRSAGKCVLDVKFRNAYDWLVRRMAEKIGPPPAFVRYPVWAWKRLRRFTCREWERGTDNIRLTVEIPDHEAVLSDLDQWDNVLNNFHNWIDGNDEAEYDWFENLPPDEQERVKLESWERIFDLKDDVPVQATFWYLRRDQIVDARYLKPRREYFKVG